MNERWLTWIAGVEHIRKIHEVAKVVDAATGNQVVFAAQVEAAHEVFEQAGIHVFVVHKTYGLAFAAPLDALLNFLRNIGADIVVDVELSIFGYFKKMGIKTVEIKVGENVFEVVAYHIFEQHDVLLSRF